MQIIILGAGQTGSSLAASLVAEHSVTLIDINEIALEDLQSQYDLRTVTGYASYPRVLAEAGADSADMIIAVTPNDETNITACFVAAAVFKIPLKIARIRAADYFLSPGNFFAADHSPVDIFINPAELITHSIMHLIEYPGALRVFDFANDRLKLIATRPLAESRLIGNIAEKLDLYLPGAAAKIIAVYRGNKEMPLATTSIALDDDILFIAENKQVTRVLGILRPSETNPPKRKRIMIAGGGYIGSQLAHTLEDHHQVKLIEQNRERCEQLARQLKNTLVLQGNGCDSLLLKNEDIENIDCFCALTNSDADNIVSALYSKQLNAKQVIALVNRDAYLSLIISGYIHIDVAVSPQQITTGAILKHLRHAHIIQAYSLRRGAAEALEIVVHSTAKAAGRSLAQLALPKGAQISAVVRDHILLLPDSTTTLQPEDRVIVFISDKTQIQFIENLFVIKDPA